MPTHVTINVCSAAESGFTDNKIICTDEESEDHFTQKDSFIPQNPNMVHLNNQTHKHSKVSGQQQKYGAAFRVSIIYR